MPRPPRLEYPGAFYHVYSRGNRREEIFRGNDTYQTFEQALLEIAVICDVSVYAWCLMPNHFHLLIETPAGNLSLFMRRLLTRNTPLETIRSLELRGVLEGIWKAEPRVEGEGLTK